VLTPGSQFRLSVLRRTALSPLTFAGRWRVFLFFSATPANSVFKPTRHFNLDPNKARGRPTKVFSPC
jgi:hypothetical protein